MKTRKQNQSDEANVDMTPMLDIVFIMLIFFIVSSTFIKESGLDLTENQNDKKQSTETHASKAIIIQICGNEKIFVDARSVDIRSVRANIERKLAEDNGAVVIVESEDEAKTGLLVAVMDQARAAKANVSVSKMAGSCEAKT